MKKLSLVLLIIFILPVIVNASSINVKSLNVSAEDKTIKYNGEMEPGSVAVMCKLYTDDKEIDYLSSEVNSSKFEGSFTVSEANTYKVSCANYEGGEFTSKEIEVKEDTNNNNKKTNEENIKNPKTNDNIKNMISISIISILSLMSTIIYIKTKKLV